MSNYYRVCMQVTMLICNNGHVGKTGHKDFKTKQFVEAARKKRR